MAKRVQRIRPLALALVMSGVLGGALGLSACHANPDDPAGQAGELTDPVRREYALGNLTRLYGKVLTEQKSNRTAEPVKKFNDATVEQLVKTYIEHPEDTRN